MTACGSRGSSSRCDTEGRHGGGDRDVAGAVRTRGRRSERRWRRRLRRPPGRRRDERRGRTARAPGMNCFAFRPVVLVVLVRRTPARELRHRDPQRRRARAPPRGWVLRRLPAGRARAPCSSLSASTPRRRVLWTLCRASFAAVSPCASRVIPLEMFAGFFRPRRRRSTRRRGSLLGSPSPAGSPARDCGVPAGEPGVGGSGGGGDTAGGITGETGDTAAGFGHDRRRAAPAARPGSTQRSRRQPARHRRPARRPGHPASAFGTATAATSTAPMMAACRRGFDVPRIEKVIYP